MVSTSKGLKQHCTIKNHEYVAEENGGFADLDGTEHSGDEADEGSDEGVEGEGHQNAEDEGGDGGDEGDEGDEGEGDEVDDDIGSESDSDVDSWAARIFTSKLKRDKHEKPNTQFVGCRSPSASNKDKKKAGDEQTAKTFKRKKQEK